MDCAVEKEELIFEGSWLLQMFMVRMFAEADKKMR